MINIKRLPALTALTVLGATTLSPHAQALDQIIRNWQSIRSSGMGGVRMTTGLYEENFFANPARVTANPSTRFELLKTGVEASSIGNIKSLIDSASGSGDIVKSLGDTAGNNTHFRLQAEPVAFYLAPTDTRKWGLALGIFSSTAIDLDLRQSFQVGAQGITDLTVPLTFGHKFLDDKLSVGTTVHFNYRLGTNPNFTFVQLLKGSSLSPSANGGQGGMIDADLGATYVLPVFEDTPYKFVVGAAFNNLLGGGFTNVKLNLVSSLTCVRQDGTVGPCAPPAANRTLGLGIGVSRESWGPFENSVLAVEFTDFGNNSNVNLGGDNPNPGLYGRGSFFRTVHIGGETRWKVFALRAGFNQGYPTAGLGIDLRFFTLDVSTYGEEMSLNAGGLQDCRLALQIGFQI